MARMRRYRPTARRKLIWARRQEVFNPLTNLPAAGEAQDLLSFFRSEGGSSLGATVTRVRVDLSLEWIAGESFNGGDAVAVGILVDQLQLNQLEVPRPGVELHADWMYWRRISPAETVTALPVAATSGVVSTFLGSLVIDVQSQRKIEELGQTLWMVVDPTFTGATALRVVANSSVLLRLP